MEVSYSLVPEDLVALQRLHFARRGKYQQFGCLLFLILLSVSLIFHWVQEGFPPAALLIAVVAWLLFLGTQWQQRRQLRKTFERHRDLLVNQRIKLTPEEIVHSSDVAVGATRWEAIRRILDTESHGFIFTTEMAAIVIPARAFSDQASFRAFIETARSYHARAIESRADRNA